MNILSLHCGPECDIFPTSDNLDLSLAVRRRLYPQFASPIGHTGDISSSDELSHSLHAVATATDDIIPILDILSSNMLQRLSRKVVRTYAFLNYSVRLCLRSAFRQLT